ncbi:MAG: sigma-70 family RNA polymerase sigma factor [Saprospiraceae bacterium]|nr:sigma-70 family RNA polymerase sigma factor [Saprospiraceae bacterium]
MSDVQSSVTNQMITNQEQIQAKIKELYKLYYSDVQNYVCNNSGQAEDARDLFQEIALNFLKMMQDGITDSIQNEKYYLMGMARNLWLKKVHKEKHTLSYEDVMLTEKADEAGNEEEKNSLFELVSNKLAEISKECQQIIYEGFYQKKSNTELAALMGYTEQFVKVKKHRCLQGLKKIILDSPDYRHLKNAF